MSELVEELDHRQREFGAAKRAARELVAGLSQEEFNRRSAEGSWSVAECLAHLIATGQAVIPKLERGIERGKAKGWYSDGPYRYGVLGNMFVSWSSDDILPPRKPLRAPKLYTPPPGPDRPIEATLAGFETLQDDYAKVVERADGLDLGRIKVSSPVTRLLRLSLGQWFRLLAGHQRRHLWQAGQVKERLSQRT